MKYLEFYLESLLKDGSVLVAVTPLPNMTILHLEKDGESYDVFSYFIKEEEVLFIQGGI